MVPDSSEANWDMLPSLFALPRAPISPLTTGTPGNHADADGKFGPSSAATEPVAGALTSTQIDPVTGLANRDGFFALLSRALAENLHRPGLVACLYIDIDDFKTLNDSLGFAAGDQLIQFVASKVQAALRPGDFLARIGGDTFAVGVANLPDTGAARAMGALIAAAARSPLTVAQHHLAPSVSIGVAVNEHTISAEHLARNANTALSLAKRESRGGVRVFSEELRTAALHRLATEGELRQAMKQGQLQVHYQPVVELASRKIMAFEALVRWQHPQRGLIYPESFIDICEDANLVVDLGQIVLQQVCQFLAGQPHFRGKIFVNISSRQVGAADLSRVLESALVRFAIDGRRIGLEITERGLLQTSIDTQADIADLHRLGADLVLDDFGSGYSGLSSLLNQRLSGLKLAREFTLRLGDRSIGDRISKSIAELARSLGMYSIIEGIETESQLSLARSHGWTYGQGFLFGAAVPPERIMFDPSGEVSLLT